MIVWSYFMWLLRFHSVTVCFFLVSWLDILWRIVINNKIFWGIRVWTNVINLLLFLKCKLWITSNTIQNMLNALCQIIFSLKRIERLIFKLLTLRERGRKCFIFYLLIVDLIFILFPLCKILVYFCTFSCFVKCSGVFILSNLRHFHIHPISRS